MLTREIWEAINRAWLVIADRSSPGGTQATLNMVEQLKADGRLVIPVGKSGETQTLYRCERTAD